MRHLAAAVLMMVVSAASAAAQPVVFLFVTPSGRTPGRPPRKWPAPIRTFPAPGSPARSPGRDAEGRAHHGRHHDGVQAHAQTGDPAAKAAGLPITVHRFERHGRADKKIRSSPGNVLVVGHSNTVPES